MKISAFPDRIEINNSMVMPLVISGVFLVAGIATVVVKLGDLVAMGIGAGMALVACVVVFFTKSELVVCGA
jgi:hypothetical protein